MATQSSAFQTRIALLQLLCVWLAFCPIAVRQFLQPAAAATDSPGSPSSNLSQLVTRLAIQSSEESEVLTRGLSTLLACICVLFHPGDTAGSDRSSIINTLKNRIGIDVVFLNLNQVYTSEAFTIASRHPQPQFRTSADLVFDYMFTQLFRRVEYKVARLFRPDGIDFQRPPSAVANASLTAYQDKVTQQEQELAFLRDRVSQLETELSGLRLSNFRQGAQPLQQGSVGAMSQAASRTSDRSNVEDPGQTSLREDLQSKLTAAEHKISTLEQRLLTLDTEKHTLETEHEDLLMLVNDNCAKIEHLELLVHSLGGSVDGNSHEGAHYTIPSQPS